MRKLHLFHAIALLTIFATAVACTSSSSTVRSNPSYDQDYSRSTRSRTTSQASSGEGFPEETYRPPVTLMMVSMTTGEVIEGESYPVIAVVDNPENRDLTYKWSVEDGKLGELPESMRSEVLGFEEQLRNNRGLSGQAAQAETAPAPETERKEGPPSGEGALAKPAGPGAEAEETRARPAPPPRPSAESEPAGEEEPAAETPPKAEEEGAVGEESEKPTENGGEAGPAEAPPTEGGEHREPERGEPQQMALNFVRYAALAPEEDETEEDEPAAEEWPEPQPKDDEGAATEELAEQVEDAAKADETDDAEVAADTEDEDATEEEPAEEELSAREAIAGKEEAEDKVEEVGETAEEFEGFKPTVGEGRLVEPEEETEEEEEGESLLDTEPPLVTTETDKPYALWTPPGTGSYTIRCIVLDDKGNELTPERSFPVTVTKPEPKTELAWNTSEKLYEDDYLVVEVRVKNVPSFGKGLFTLKFNPAELSFRLVETGDFFPDDYRTSLFYAQPPNNPGKVTVAISADEVGLPKGEGVAARTIFKVKETINDPTKLNISEVMSEEARYILDAEGVNVLPQVTEHPVYATEWTEPPERPQQKRSETRSNEGIPSAPEPPVSSRASGGGTSGRAGTTAEGGTAPQSGSARLGGGGGGRQQATTGPTDESASEQEELDSSLIPKTGPLSIDGLEERKRQIIEDESLSQEEKDRLIADIERQIQAMLEAGAEAGGESGPVAEDQPEAAVGL